MVREMIGYLQEYQGPKGHLLFADRAQRDWQARIPRLVEMVSRTYPRGGLSTGNSISRWEEAATGYQQPE
jgi:hypothetical protein